MRSSTGQHFVALDHVRALAAFLVFSVHFLNLLPTEHPSHLEALVPLWLAPLAVIKEGHVGVALFMVLSGYLFAKLLDGREINFALFLFNRALRLFPLLLFVFAAVGLWRWHEGRDVWGYLQGLLHGFVLPIWPSGGWSIATELHFYLVLPWLLWIARRSPVALACIVLCAIGLRAWLWSVGGEVQSLAYFTIVGRIDQFVLGILAWHLRGWFVGNHARAAFFAVAFIAFYWWFSYEGGFRGMPSYPSPSAVWVFIPAIEGAAFAALIAWYDGSFRFRNAGLSGALAKVGAWSFSIYLLHRFYVDMVPPLLHRYVADMSNLYVAMGLGVVAFVAFLPLAWASYMFIERPFLRHRVTYLTDGGVHRGARVPASA